MFTQGGRGGEFGGGCIHMLIGHQKQKELFEYTMANGTLTHAYLFSGPAMIGKKVFAYGLAARVSGYDLTAHPDCMRIAPRIADGETKIYIEDIRQILSFLSLTPHTGPYKWVLIDDADRLTEEASNALLKVLEEPPPSAKLILISSQPKSLLPTIRSRCQEIRFLPQSPDEIAEYLTSKKVKKEDADLITLLAGGRIGWVISCLESNKLAEIKKSIQEFQQVVRRGIPERLVFAKRVSEMENSSETIDLWMRWIRAFGKNPAKTHLALSQLLDLHALVSQPQFNHRLALENFLISI